MYYIICIKLTDHFNAERIAWTNEADASFFSLASSPFLCGLLLCNFRRYSRFDRQDVSYPTLSKIPSKTLIAYFLLMSANSMSFWLSDIFLLILLILSRYSRSFY